MEHSRETIRLDLFHRKQVYILEILFCVLMAYCSLNNNTLKLFLKEHIDKHFWNIMKESLHKENCVLLY